MEQIKFSDLFDEGGISSGLNNMVTKIESVKAELLNMLKEVKEASANISSSLSSTSSVSKGGRDDVRVQAGNVEQLYSAYQELTKAINECNKNLVNLSSAQAKAASSTRSAISAQKAQAQGQMSLAQAYSTLSELIQQTGVSVEQLLQSQRQLNIAQKNGEVAAKSATGSYNQLYAQYNLIKNVLNAMSAEMRNAEGVGKLWEAEALRIMNAMKGMQEATGKHTLSVGDYTKAFNGLSIATQQVLREMPTLANSLQQFFIAISNNVPIFVDNLMAVQKATGSWALAMKGVLTSLFSWQTALLVVLTILPKIAQAIHDKRKANEEEAKAQEKSRKETEKAVKAYRALYDILSDIRIKAGTSIVEVSTLTRIINDNSRAVEDRIAAGKRLKQIFDEELNGYSAEEIAIGKAKIPIQKLTTFIYEQAKARAILNEITELTQKQLKLEERAKQYENFKVGTRTVKELSEAIDEAKKKGQSVRLGVYEQQNVDTYRSIMSEMQGLQKQIESLIGKIDPSKLLDGTKDTLDKITDYYWEWAESNAKIIKDAENRELALNDVKYEKAKDTYQKILDEQKVAGTLTAKQEKYLTGIILNLETERQQSRLAIIDKYYNQLWEKISKKYDTTVLEETIEEEDMSISGKYEKTLANLSKQILSARKSLNDSLVKGSYKEAKQEGSVLNDLLAQKIEAEANYQKALLLMRLESKNKATRITKDQYDIELAIIDENLAKALNKLKGKQRRNVDIWDLLFGSKQTDEYGNVFKKLDEESKAFINQLISSLNTAMQYMDEFMNKRIEMAEIAVEAAQKESEAAKTNLDYEMEARANGYANNVSLARKEYEEKLALEQQAIDEKKRLQKIQEGIDTATQISSLVTATAQLWAAYASIPWAGQALAIAATALMWGSFTAAKITAAQLANAKTYGEGGMEYINYGGSHASGNDVDFGRTKEGRPRRVEKGEVVSVINKKNVEKYGVSRIENIINSLNNGTFEKQYSIAGSLSKSSSVVESTERNTLGDIYSLAFSMLGMPTRDGADLSSIERGISTLVSQNDVRIIPTTYGRIEYRGNNKRIIHNS